MLKKHIQRIKFLLNAKYGAEKSFTIFDKSADITIGKNCNISINGILKIGGALPGCLEIPSYHKTYIVLEDNSKLVINGNVYIATGTFIHVKKNATLILDGDNFIGHNNFIMCSKDISIGKNTSTSWNVTLIDHDGHNLYFHNGKSLKMPIRPLKISDNVGIQMNVTIPHGITIKQNSLIGANTVVREDIPNDTFVYYKNELRIKNGISVGLQFIT